MYLARISARRRGALQPVAALFALTAAVAVTGGAVRLTHPRRLVTRMPRRAARAMPYAPGAVAALHGLPTAPEIRASRPAAVSYERTVSAGVPLHVVRADLNSPQLRMAVVTPENGIGSREEWGTMVDRARPTAAITGTYFCTQSGIPIGSIVSAGRVVHTGDIGTAFAFNPGRGAAVLSCRPCRAYNWRGFDTVLRAGPRLLTAGRTTLCPEAEGFRDPEVYARKPRVAVAVTRRNQLLLVTTQRPVLLGTLAEALRRMDVSDAMCMDGGGSTALYYRGKTRVKPGRPLTNLLVLYDRSSRYEEVVDHLSPTRQVAGAFLNAAVP